jgi:hypothetical protein
MSDEPIDYDRMGRLLDQKLMSVLEEGMPLTKGNGDPLLTDDGKVIYGPPNAAVLSIIVARLKSQTPRGKPKERSATADFMATHKARIPGVNIDDRDAAGEEL